MNNFERQIKSLCTPAQIYFFLSMFSILAIIFLGILILHIFELIGEGLAIAGWTGLCGAAGVGVAMRGVQAAAREKARINSDEPIGIREEDDG